MNKVIGGEFEIGYRFIRKINKEVPKEFAQGYFYSSGRAAIFHILNFLIGKGKQQILLPDYLCGSIVDAVKLTSLPFEFYSINSDLTINTDSVREKLNDESIILIINYFGGTDVHGQIKKIKSVNSNATIILDNAQALFSMFESYDADFMLTSFRKQLPVPDGAWVLSRYDGLFLCQEPNSFSQYKLGGGILKSLNRPDAVSEEVYLDLFKKGDSLILNNIYARISDVTCSILNEIDIASIRQRRLENSQYLIQGLKKLDIAPILEFKNNEVPLFVPVLINYRDHLRQELRKQGIYSPAHWPKCKEVSQLDKRLYRDELSLIIDQRYNLKHMNKILGIIKKYLNHVQ
jgi:hypothetical protein